MSESPGTFSILVVDDEARLRDNLATLLGASGYRVATSAAGDEAMAVLRAQSFDLVLTDIMMEGADGFALIAWIQEHAACTLVTVITGFASMESTIKALRLGAFDYLVKPFDFELLAISVERAARRIQADRDRERTHAELESWSRQLAVVNDLGRRAAATLSEEALLNLVVRALHERFRYHHVYVSVLDEANHRLVIRAQAGAYEDRMPRDYTYEAGTGISGRVIASGLTVIVNDVRSDPDYIELVPETRSQVTLPVLVDGRAIAALSVESAEASSFGPRDVTLLETLADMVASSIQTVRLFQQIKETKDYLEALIASSADAIVTTDTKGIVTFFSPGAESVYGYGADEVIGRPVAEYYLKGAAEAQKIMSHLLKKDRLKNHQTVLLGRGGKHIHASISASLLRRRDGQILGTLGVSKDVTQRVELERKLKELTITDSLTGLFNQRFFCEKLDTEMERARRQRRELALMLFDLDRFKDYNDTYGHLEGDRLLRQVGSLVQESIRNMVDSGFRYGGDEFVVILPELVGEQALAVVGRIKSKIEAGLAPHLRISTGLATFRADYQRDEFVRLADEAMYEAKKARDGRIVLR